MCMPAHAQKFSLKTLKKEVWDRIKVSGYRRVGIHGHSVSGDRTAFDVTNYGGQGNKTFTDQGLLQVEGRNVYGLFNFRANVLDSRFNDPTSDSWTIDFERKGWLVNIGDLRTGSLSRQQFVNADKTLRGAAIGYRSGRMTLKTMRSESRGSARTISINGNNGPGPYYLQASQIIPNSERVLVNGVDQVVGSDYVINYELGSVTFAGKIIAPSDTIVISFEAFGFNQRRGKVEGASAVYDFGKGGTLSMISMKQVQPGASGASTRLEKFQGFGAAGTPYILQFEPLTGTAVTIRLDGILQSEGTDYTFDAQSRAIFYFTRFVPSTSTIDVIYTPKPTGTASGNRSNFGLEYRLPIKTKDGEVRLVGNQSFGRQTGVAASSSGTARGLSANWVGRKYEIDAKWRSVPNGFVAVESVGFNRNEKAVDLHFGGKPSDTLRWDLNQSNSSIKVDSTTGPRSSRFVRTAGSLNYTSGITPYTLTHSRLRSYTSEGPQSLNSTEISTGSAKGFWAWNFRANRQTGSTPNGSSLRTFAVDGVRAGTTYSGLRGVIARLDLGLANVRTLGEKATGRDIDAFVSYKPSEGWDISSRYAISDSGEVATLSSFQSGFGLGYGGNGFSAGSNSNNITGATDLRLFQVLVNRRISDDLHLSAGHTRSRTTGSVTSNSSTTTSSLGAQWSPDSRSNLSLSLDQTDTKFVGSPVTSGATSLQLNWDHSPPGRLQYNVGVLQFLTKGNSAFRQDSRSYLASANYFLGGRHTIGLNLISGLSAGYQAQNDFDTSVVYQYKLFNNLALIGSYRFRNVQNRDGSNQSGAYRSHSFDLEIGFNILR